MMVRGLDQGAILREGRERADFLRRLAALAENGTLAVSAWTRVPSPADLRVRTGQYPLVLSLPLIETGV